jgi:multicomponent Na+:H+ antiporter subunit A
VLLVGVSLVLGVAPAFGTDVVNAAVQALDPGAEAVKLKLWHGFNLALLLSVITVGAGTVLFVQRRRVARLQARIGRVPTGDDLYLAALRGLNLVADRVTGVVQSGSLPIYIGVILLTAVTLPAVALLQGDRPAIAIDGWSGPVDVAVAVLVVAGTLTAIVVRRRIVAVLGLGVAGYGMGLFFVSQGAPDLALTQFTVETLGVVLFVLVLRRLPDRFTHRPPPFGRAIRLVISAAVGTFVVAFSLFAQSARTAPPISTEYVARALPEGGGRNVVNVILVDFRGLDTLGEITVLAVAAIGVVSLARIGRYRASGGDATVEPAAAPGAAAEDIAP